MGGGEKINVIARGEQSRALLLKLLGSAGVKWPYEPKLPAPQLRKLLEKALDFSQDWESINGSLEQEKVDMGLLKAWKLEKPGERIHTAVQRWSIQERFSPLVPTEHSYADQLDRSLQLPEPFLELRKVPMALANAFNAQEEALRNVIFTTPEKRWTTFVLLKEVLVMNESTPIFLVQAFVDDTGERAQEVQGKVRDFQQQMRAIRNATGSQSVFPCVKVCSREEHLALRILLEMNSKRLRLNPSIPLDDPLDAEEMSFILPLGPIDRKDLGHLANQVGCAICGKANVKKCSRCSQVSYCGPECQKKDWPIHKEACTPVNLANATWQPFDQRSSEMNHMSFFNVGNNPSKGPDQSFDANTICPNPHGDRPFITKVQVTTGGAAILIYDRKRELTWQHFGRTDDAARKIMHLVQQKGYLGGKLFMWTKRTGDKEIQLCMDNLPKQDFGW